MQFIRNILFDEDRKKNDDHILDVIKSRDEDEFNRIFDWEIKIEPNSYYIVIIKSSKGKGENVFYKKKSITYLTNELQNIINTTDDIKVKKLSVYAIKLFDIYNYNNSHILSDKYIPIEKIDKLNNKKIMHSATYAILNFHQMYNGRYCLSIVNEYMHYINNCINNGRNLNEFIDNKYELLGKCIKFYSYDRVYVSDYFNLEINNCIIKDVRNEEDYHAYLHYQDININRCNDDIKKYVIKDIFKNASFDYINNFFKDKRKLGQHIDIMKVRKFIKENVKNGKNIDDYFYDDCVNKNEIIREIVEETSFHDINNIRKKLEELETHIMYMPEGEGYAEAKDHFEKSIKE